MAGNNIKLNIDIKNPQHQMVILSVLIAALAAILYFTLILNPQISRVFSAVGKNIKMKVEVGSMEESISNIDRYRSEIGTYRDKVERYERVLPAEQEIPTLLENLSSMAKNSGVKIVGITPVAAIEDKKQHAQVYQEIPILINAKSGYHELGNFIANLESADRFMKIVDIGIKMNRASPKKHDVELLVLTYVLSKGKA